MFNREIHRHALTNEISIAVIGGGWYGLYISLVLRSIGYHVTVFEKESDILKKVSGNFGIRLHAGAHYPRSLKTRESCQRGLYQFRKRFPELVIEHEYAIYGLGRRDAENQPSHVNYQTFKSVCEESKSYEINPERWGLTNLVAAWNFDEPSIVLGDRLRNTFKKYLSEAKVNIKCNYEVKTIKKQNKKILISNDESNYDEYDFVINATGYQAFTIPEKDFPLKMDIYFQPLLALVYEDMKAEKKPFSLIIMDGLYPCIMPCIDNEEESKDYRRKYILTHAKWTTLASCKTVREAHQVLANINDNFIDQKIKPACEEEIMKFWPEFNQRFTYLGWKGTVLVKLKTNSEFRSAITFENDGIIHIIPGKINNIFDVEREVLALIQDQDILTYKNFRIVINGILHEAAPEITEKSNLEKRNTCSQQTYRELLAKKYNQEQENAVQPITFFNSQSRRSIARDNSKKEPRFYAAL